MRDKKNQHQGKKAKNLDLVIDNRSWREISREDKRRKDRHDVGPVRA